MHYDGKVINRMNKFKKTMLCIVYWLISLTWGCLGTIPGLIVALGLSMAGYRPHRNGYGAIFEIGGNWGGFSMGPISLCGSYYESSRDWYEHTRRHEFGHSIQQLVLGPFQILLVTIPSIIRYWYQRIRTAKGLENVPYDQAIFEYTASKYGYLWVNAIENESKEYTFERK